MMRSRQEIEKEVEATGIAVPELMKQADEILLRILNKEYQKSPCQLRLPAATTGSDEMTVLIRNPRPPKGEEFRGAGIIMKAALDTGAPMTTINHETGVKLGFKLDNTEPDPDKTIRKVLLELNVTRCNRPATVLASWCINENAERPECIIPLLVGADYLQAANISLGFYETYGIAEHKVSESYQHYDVRVLRSMRDSAMLETTALYSEPVTVVTHNTNRNFPVFLSNLKEDGEHRSALAKLAMDSGADDTFINRETAEELELEPLRTYVQPSDYYGNKGNAFLVGHAWVNLVDIDRPTLLEVHWPDRQTATGKYYCCVLGTKYFAKVNANLVVRTWTEAQKRQQVAEIMVRERRRNWHEKLWDYPIHERLMNDWVYVDKPRGHPKILAAIKEAQEKSKKIAIEANK